MEKLQKRFGKIILRMELSKILSWSVVIAISAFYVFELIPAKGVDFTDEGHYLYEAWALSQPGVPLDNARPQAPSYIFNGALMLLGVDSYYGLRICYHLFILVCFYTFFWGIYKEEGMPAIIPVIASFGLLGTNTTLISYQNTPVLLLLAAGGIFYYHLGQSNLGRKKIFATISGAVFGISGFINMGIAPAALIATLFLSVVYKKECSVRYFWGGFLGVFGFLMTVYYELIPSGELFRAAAGHSLADSLKRILKVAEFDLFWLVPCVILMGPFLLLKSWKRLGLDFRESAGLSLAVCTLVFFGFFATHIIYHYDWLTKFNLHWIKNLDLITKYIDVYWTGHIGMMFGNLGFALFWLSLISSYKGSQPHKRLFIMSVLVFVYFSAQTSTTIMSIANPSIFYSSPLLAIAAAFFCIPDKGQRYLAGRIKPLLKSLILVGIIVIGLFYQVHYSFTGITFMHSTEPVHVAKLNGLREITVKKDTLEKLSKIYAENNCAEKRFVSFANTPLLYYLFERPALGRTAWIHPNYDHQVNEVMSALKSETGYCAFLWKGFLTEGQWLELKTEWDYIEKNHSQYFEINTSNIEMWKFDIYIS